MSARERETGELPFPICPGSTERLDRDLLFFEVLLVLMLIVINRKNIEDENDDEDEGE
jgi:hypothetical protein